MTAGHDTVVLVVQDGDSTSPDEVDRWLREHLEGRPPFDVLLTGWGVLTQAAFTTVWAELLFPD